MPQPKIKEGMRHGHHGRGPLLDHQNELAEEKRKKTLSAAKNRRGVYIRINERTLILADPRKAELAKAEFKLKYMDCSY